MTRILIMPITTNLKGEVKRSFYSNERRNLQSRGEEKIMELTKQNGTARLLSIFMDAQSVNTRRAYLQDLEDFAAFIGAENPQDACRAFLALRQPEALMKAFEYRSALAKRRMAAATINRRLAALRSVVKLARNTGMVSWSLEVPNVRAYAYRDTRGPGVAAFRKMLAAARLQRDKALLWLLYSPALRRAEACALDATDVDFGNRRIAVRGKGRTEKQWITMPKETAAAVAAHLAQRGDHEGPVFEGHGRKRLSAAGLWFIVRQIGRKVGIRVRPHGLRHTGITEAVKAAQRAGMGIEEVLAFSRHRNLSTLMVYRDNERDVGGEIAGLAAQAVGGK